MVDFIRDWGYVAVFLGACIEGESIILPAGLFAYMGVFSLPGIMFVAFLGTFFMDQALYLVGRYFGVEGLFRYFPKLEKHSHKAFALLHKYDIFFILSFRFIYGIRIISSAVVGAAGVSPARFVPLNFIAAVIWSVTSCGIGYGLGFMLGATLENWEQYQYYIFAVVAAICVIIWLFVFWKERFHKGGDNASIRKNGRAL